MSMTAAEKALILLQEVNDSLARGTRHFNASGKELFTPKEVIETLLSEGRVTFQPNITKKRGTKNG